MFVFASSGGSAFGDAFDGRGGLFDDEEFGLLSSRSRSRLGRGGDRMRVDVPSPFLFGERERERRGGRSDREGW